MVGILPVLILGLIASAPAVAGSAEGGRVALVIGNGAYRHGQPLQNPSNDARAVAARLAAIGFDLGSGALLDADKRAMETALRAFRQRSQGAAMAMFFYAGHGIQAADRNLLLPVDSALRDPADVDLETVAVDTVLGQMRAEINLVVLDACRENPFESRLQRSAVQLGRDWSGGRGFRRIDPRTLRGGSMVALAAAPGAIAADGAGSHSPYTAALLDHLASSDLSVRLLFARVREQVEAATAGRQSPETIDRLPSHDVYFVPKGSVVTVAPPAATPVDADALSCRALATSSSVAAFDAYLLEFPHGQCAAFARIRLAELSRSQPASGGASPTGPAGPQTAMVAPGRLPPEDGELAIGLTRDRWRAVQVALNRLGHGAGTPDGLPGARTRSAIRAWQRAASRAATGYLTSDGYHALLQAAAAAVVDRPLVNSPILEQVRVIRASDHERVSAYRGLSITEVTGRSQDVATRFRQRARRITRRTYERSKPQAEVVSGFRGDRGYYLLLLRAGAYSAFIEMAGPAGPRGLSETHKRAMGDIACTAEYLGTTLGCRGR